LTPREMTAARQSFTERTPAPGKPTGNNTDLGQAIDRALDDLNRPEANRSRLIFFFTRRAKIQAFRDILDANCSRLIFFFTSSNHDPPANSKQQLHLRAAAPWWPILAIGLSLLAGLFAGYLYWFKPEKINGTVTVKKQGALIKRQELIDQSVLYIGNTDNCQKHGIFIAELTRDEREFELELIGRKPKLLSRWPPRGIYARMIKGAGRMETRRINPKTNQEEIKSIVVPVSFSSADEPLPKPARLIIGECEITWN